MRVVPRADHDEVDVRVVKHFLRARHRVRKPKSLSHVVRRDSRSRRYRTKLNAFGFEVRQQHRRHVATRANHSEHDRLLRLPHRRRRTERNFARHLCFRIVVENHAQVRLLHIARDQLVSTIGFSDRKPVRRQTLDIDPLLADRVRESSRCFASQSNARKAADSRDLFLHTQDRNDLVHTTSK